MRRISRLVLPCVLAAFAGACCRGAARKEPPARDDPVTKVDEAVPLDSEGATLLNLRGAAAYARGEHDEAIKDFDAALRLDPWDPFVFYEKACCLAARGKAGPALEALGKALKLGFRDFARMEQDADLASIRGEPSYKRLLEKCAP